MDGSISVLKAKEFADLLQKDVIKKDIDTLFMGFTKAEVVCQYIFGFKGFIFY